MKKLLTKICVPLVIVLIATSLGAFPVTYAANPDAQEKALAFIENVLPVDLSRYTVTLTGHTTLDGIPILGADGLPIAIVKDIVQYTLDSEESTLDVFCKIQNNVLTYCEVTEKKGQVISDKQCVSLIDAVKGFLEKYQNYTNIDSTNLIGMLDNVDATKDSTITIGNTKFTISNIDYYGFELTTFKWVYTVNGADYTSLQISFHKNGALYTLHDDRAVYSIGDTTVNISHEQAIDIAMKYSETYSYAMPDGSQVSGFNITEDQSTAKLVAYPIHSAELRPYWDVELYLNQTYPGYVHGLTIYVWANSGEVCLCSNIAYGGAEYNDADNSGSELPSTSPSSSSDDSASSVDISTAAILAVAAAATVVAIAASALFIKKRNK